MVVGAWALFDHLFIMDHYPQEGETVLLPMDSARAETVYYGDCSLNIAVLAARYGIPTGVVTVVGNDFESSGYAEYLQERKVDLTGVTVLESERSGHNYIFFDERGDGFCFSHQGAAAMQKAGMISEDWFVGVRHVVICEMFSEYTLRAMQVARQQGAIIYISGMVAESDALLEQFLALTDVLFINRSEFSRLTERIGSAERLFKEFGLQRVFLTCGRQGAKVLEADGSETQILPVEVEGVVDTTGAGDAFVAGTVSALIRGYSAVKAAEIGAVTSSFIIQQWGCQTNAPTWEQMDERYRAYIALSKGDFDESH